MIIEDKEITALYLIGKTENAKLSDVDTVRLQYFYFLVFNAWEFSYYQNKDDSISPELWLGQDGWVRSEIRSTPALRATWQSFQESFAEPFRSYVDGLISHFNATGELPDNKPAPHE